ncbi:MAG: ATP-binding protein [Acidimicrobiales bacterium]
MLERRAAHLGGDLNDVAEARHSVTEWLLGWDLGRLVDDVQLVASELTTNAILHAGGGVDVVLERRGGGVRVVVHDGRPDVVPSPPVLPPPPGADGDDGADDGGDDEVDRLVRSLSERTTTGRGLMLVEAFSDTWGVDVGSTTKGVWAEVGTGGSAQPGTRDPAAAGPPEVGSPVRLLGLSVRLVLLSAANLDDLVRELQTTDFDAAAPTELAGIGERLAKATSAQREPLRMAARAALQRRRRTVDLDITVPPSQVAVLRRLVSLTGQVEELCRTGVLLSVPPAPEVTAFRFWYVDELRRQLDGEPPSPCPFPG